MDRIIQSPGKYIQGAGAIKRLGDYLKPLAERWLVVGDKFVLGFAEEMLRKSLADAGLAAEIAPFGGECSHNEINRLRDIAGSAKCTAVLGIGGGKTLDTAKALAHFMKVPVAIAPTIASTDAPCSALSVIYTDEGEFDSYLMLPQNPNMVIVDTQIVAGAPARLLAALADAKYVAPYVNRVDAQGGDGIRMVQELQSLLEMHAPDSKVLAASFKTPRQALDCLLAGCEAITLPLDVAQQMLGTPAVESAIEKFEQDWNNAFGTLNL